MSTSLIKIQPSQVQQMCTNTLKSIRRHRNYLRDTYVTNVCNKRNNGPFHKLFGLKNYTKEQIKEEIIGRKPRNNIFWNVYIPSILVKQELVAIKLALAATTAVMNTNNDMFISTDDFYDINSVEQ